MTLDTSLPLSRPFSVDKFSTDEAEIRVEATADECRALAKADDLPELTALVGTFTIRRTRPHHYAVSGVVRARITQRSVVSLETFDTDLEEPVELSFVEGDANAASSDPDTDPPDPIVDGVIDFGALTAEFLALGLDPYPRKPGETFAEPADDNAGASSPFAALAALKGKPPEL